MSIQITNTLTRNKEDFTPMEPKQVRMYVCGPTVYNFIHIGNARPYVFFDVVRRFLEYSGYAVKMVVNYTDVDDKIIDRARKEKKAWNEITETYIAEYVNDMQTLGVLEPHARPRVTEFVPQIIQLIEGLIANGAAYEVDGEVFFAVRKFTPYGKLSGKNIDDLISGARVEPGVKKRDPLDFSLWKPQKAEDEPAWQSPWGMGRPGWHIECSAMAINLLGETFDIHGGGIDLIHPHHENEVAQSEAFTHKPFVRYWMHNNMLSLDSVKMSKSIGNIVLTREFLEQFGAETLKFMLLSGHYRSQIDFSPKTTKDSQAALHRVYSALKKAKALANAEGKAPAGSSEELKVKELSNSFEPTWKAAMEDDFNTAKVLGTVFYYVRAFNAYVDKKGFKVTADTAKVAQNFLSDLEKLSGVINIFGRPSEEFLAELRNTVLKEKSLLPGDIDKLIAQRVQARQNKDFQTADALRQELLAKGIELRDSANGTEWDVIFAE